MDFRQPWNGDKKNLALLNKYELEFFLQVVSDVDHELRRDGHTTVMSAAAAAGVLAAPAESTLPFWGRHGFKGEVFQRCLLLDDSKEQIRKQLLAIWDQIPPEAIQVFVMTRFNQAHDYVYRCADAVRECRAALPLPEGSVFQRVMDIQAEELDQFEEDD
jgi:hypothetical protein